MWKSGGSLMRSRCSVAPRAAEMPQNATTRDVQKRLIACSSDDGFLPAGRAGTARHPSAFAARTAPVLIAHEVPADARSPHASGPAPRTRPPTTCAERLNLVARLRHCERADRADNGSQGHAHARPRLRATAAGDAARVGQLAPPAGIELAIHGLTVRGGRWPTPAE